MEKKTKQRQILSETTNLRRESTGKQAPSGFYLVGSLIPDSSYVLLGKSHKLFQCLFKHIIKKLN